MRRSFNQFQYFLLIFSMKRFSLSVFASTLALASLLLTSCKKDEQVAANTGEFTLHMTNMVGTAPLALDVTTYQAPNGDSYTVNAFRYYISNVVLRKGDNSTYAVPNTYFLVDQAEPNTHDLVMKDVPVGDYTGITFTIGVDSTRSKAGNFTGVLSSSEGLLWTMNGGPEFINMEFKGTSPQSYTGGLLFHIAGYMHSTTNTIRTITRTFPAAGSPMLVRAGRSPKIHMTADVNKMFDGQYPIRFSSTYSVMGGIPQRGASASQLADNIAAGMFNVAEVQAN